MQRVADQVFLLTPSNVEVSQEEKDRLQAPGSVPALTPCRDPSGRSLLHDLPRDPRRSRRAVVVPGPAGHVPGRRSTAAVRAHRAGAAPVRRVIPPAGMFDISFMVVFFVLFILQSLPAVASVRDENGTTVLDPARTRRYHGLPWM